MRCRARFLSVHLKMRCRIENIHLVYSLLYTLFTCMRAHTCHAIPAQTIVAWVAQFVEDENEKIPPRPRLLIMSDASAFVEKLSAGRKMLSKLFGEFARAFTSHYPISTIPLRKQAFRVLWSFFPNFAEFEHHPCEYKERKATNFITMCYHMFTTSVSAFNHRRRNQQRVESVNY